MRHKSRTILLLVAFSVFLLTLTIVQGGQTSRILIISGYSGELPILDLNGHSYVDIEALARLANGSLSFDGNQVVLTLPGAPAGSGSTTASDQHGTAKVLSKDFIRTGIEAMSAIREWRSALTNAVRRGYPIMEEWVTSYRDQARKGLHLAEVAASTDADKACVPLLTNEFNNMNALSNRILEATRTRAYIHQDSIDEDLINQKVLSCAHSLAAMAANGQFVDDGLCH